MTRRREIMWRHIKSQILWDFKIKQLLSIINNCVTLQEEEGHLTNVTMSNKEEEGGSKSQNGRDVTYGWSLRRLT